MSSHLAAHTLKRRSKRIEESIPIIVHGVGSLREPYQDQVSTLVISCHGCSYQSKHEVLQGETVYLDIKPRDGGSVACSTRAQVKWVQRLPVKERAFHIAVELEVAGNIWGISTPPADWFPHQLPQAIEPAVSGRELKLVTRKEPQAAPEPDRTQEQTTHLARGEAPAAPIPPLAQLMVGVGEQIQAMASEAAAAALAKDKGRLLDEFRAQLRDEAIKTIQSVISASKEVIVHQGMKELRAAREAGARNSHALWRKQIEQDMETARKHLLGQGKEMTERMDAMALSTIKRVESEVEATRSQAVDHFVARIRDQVAPMLDVARDSLQRLEGAEAALRKESEAIFAGIENQLAYTTNEGMTKAQEDLEKAAAAHTARTNQNLFQLYQSFEKAAQENVELLLASLGSQMTAILHEKADEVSREFSAGLEGYTRNYLESIGKSIAEIPRNVPVPVRSDQ